MDAVSVHSSGRALLDGTGRWQCNCGQVVPDGAAWRQHDDQHRPPPPPRVPVEHEAVTRLVAALNDTYTPDGVVQWLTDQAERLEALADGVYL